MSERRIQKLISRMTLREKLGQMSQLHGSCDEHKQRIREGRVGSLLNAGDLRTINECQRIAVEESRLRIPLIIGRDVIHGYRTAFPIPLGQAAAWNPELTEKAARIAAREASACGIRWTFAPMVDIARDPRWGRIAEGCGEDPHLAATLGAAMVRGFQGRRLGAPDSIAACAKHYAAYGATEGGRDYNTTDPSERTLRDVYLPPFKACVDAGAATLMSAFNEISGIPATGNPWTLREVLRREWGFDGFVVSDWESIREMIPHGYCADLKEAGLKALAAGVDMEMVSTAYSDHVEALLAEKQLSMDQVDEAVCNILRVKFRLGLFEKPYADPARQAIVLSDEHLAVARELARECAVLLKNDGGMLPLSKSIRSIAVIGPLADNGLDQMGCWTMDGKPEDSRTPLQAIREAVGASARVEFAPGVPECRSADPAGIEDAVRAAKSAEVAVLFVGESANLSGEAHSRAFLDLPGAQQRLVEAVHATGTPTVVVALAGRPLTLPWILDHVPALLWAWHPGTMGGPAIADVLFGECAPSGKLPVSFPRTVGQIPIHYNHKNTGRPPIESGRRIPMGTPLDPVGFCSNYLDVEHTPQFPFGFGLSYTTFEYRKIRVSPERVRMGGRLRISAEVANTGNREGTEVVQLYVRDLVGSVTRPVKELKGFRRISLRPGEARTVGFDVSTDDLAFHDAAMKRTAEPGKFRAWIAGDSATGPYVEFSLEGVSGRRRSVGRSVRGRARTVRKSQKARRA